MKAALWFRWVVFICLLILLHLISIKAEAGSPIGSYIVISKGSEQEVSPAIAYNSQRQEYLVVWYNDRPGCDDIRSQRVASNGKLAGSPFYISAGCPVDRRYPDVTYNSVHDQYLVVWEQYDSSYGYSIQGRRVAGNGQLLDTSDITIRSNGANLYTPAKPAVAYASYSDRYLVVWAETWHPTPITYDIYGQVMTDNGGLENSRFSISSGTEILKEPDLAYNRHANRYLVVWQQLGTSYDYIYEQEVHGMGGLYLNNQDIWHYSHPIFSLAIAALPNSPNEIKYMMVIEALYASSTHAVWNCPVKENVDQAACSATISANYDDDSSPTIAASESSLQYFFVWRRTFQASGDSNVLGKAIFYNETLVFEVSEFLGENADLPVVAAGPAGDFLVVWQDQPVGATDTNIYGQLWGIRVYLPATIH